MGYHFEIEHANLVAYLTTPNVAAPRTNVASARSLLGSIAYGQPNERRGLLSRDTEWLHTMQEEARTALTVLAEMPWKEQLDPDALNRIFSTLRLEFSRFALYALVVDDGRSQHASGELDAAARQLAYGGGTDVLVLIPEFVSSYSMRVLDPLPAFAAALENTHRWPGILLWTPQASVAFVDLDALSTVIMDLRLARTNPDRLNEMLMRLRSGRASKRLLHLSDLHFGTAEAAENQQLLDSELHDIVRTVDRVVITGDLFDNPRSESANLYRSFNASLHRLSGKPPVIIPGNHDQRWLGNFGRIHEHIAHLNWSATVSDESIGVNFACFNSCEAGSFARGKISAAQFTRVGGALRALHAANPATKRFLTVALVHHHPFSFKTKATTWTQRALQAIGLNDESFLAMDDAPEFLDWCARWRVSAVLHGHKHVPRHTSETIAPEGASRFEVTAIGCGSSLGAERSPISYVLLSWDDRSQRWTASFFESRNGGPFICQLVSVSSIEDAAP